MIRKGWVSLLLASLLTVFSVVTAEAMVIVEKGIPRARIVIAAQPTRTAEYAAGELRDYIKKISGAELRIERAGREVNIRRNINCLFVGPSAYTKKLGIRVDDLKPDGFRVIAKDNWLALVGRDYKGEPVYPYGETGSLYAVYNFLRDFLGVRWFMPGAIGEVVPQRKTVTVQAVNYKKEPDFAYRHLYAFSFSADPAAAVWYRRAGFGASWNVDINHSFWRFYRANPGYSREYPQIFSLVDGKRQTEAPPERRNEHWGNGNFDLANPLTLRLWVKYIRGYFDKYPERKIYPVVPNDVMYIKGWSQDARSRAQYDLDKPFEAQYSNYVWKFVNDVAKEVYKTNPDRWIGGLAYEQYRQPPSRIDKLSPNVAVMITKRRCNYWDRDYRKRMNLFIDQWQKKAKRIYIWEYYNYYVHPPFKMQYPLEGIPVIFSHVISKDLKRLKGVSGGEFIEAETWKKNEARKLYGRVGLDLMFYLTGSLLWDADRNVDKLLDDYYSKFYGPARGPMKQFFTRAEEVWMNPDKRKKSNLRLLYTDKVTNELLGYLNEAREKAGNSIYGKRVALIYSECLKMKEVRDKFESLPVYICKQAADSPRLDGSLSDKAWENAQKIEFVEQITGKRPKYRTEARIIRDKKNLYFAFVNYEPDMSNLKAMVFKRDGKGMWGTDDTIEIFLRPRENVKNYYQIMINSAGTVWDSHYVVDSRGKRNSDVSWNANVEVKIKKGKDKWIMEVKIPLADLGIPNLPGTSFRANFNRVRPGPERKWPSKETELSAWSPTYVPSSHTLDRFGTIIFK